jgi:16S rRNA U516 pseudouridylate synthase RsuA-like enzyme
MRRVNWTITERQHQELKRLSQQTGLPISELVRRAIDKYVGLVGEEIDASIVEPDHPQEAEKERV